MDWYFYSPDAWDDGGHTWANIWLWPLEGEIAENMGNKINLTINALDSVLASPDSREHALAKRLKASNQPYWIWPYPDADWWEDDVAMIVDVSAFQLIDVPRYAKAYLEARGFSVNSIRQATHDEAFLDADTEDLD